MMKSLQHRLKVLKMNPFNLAARGVFSIYRDVISKSSQAVSDLTLRVFLRADI